MSMITIDDVIGLIQEGYRSYIANEIRRCEKDNSDTIAFFYIEEEKKPVNYRELFCESPKSIEMNTSKHECTYFPISQIKTLLLLT